MSLPVMKDLLEAGVHFGHPTRKWDPRMKPFIFQERNDIYIIDLMKTLTYVKNNGIRQSFAYGAGNAFAGAFIASILKGLSQQDAHEVANQAAVNVCLASCKNP